MTLASEREQKDVIFGRVRRSLKQRFVQEADQQGRSQNAQLEKIFEERYEGAK